MPPFILPNRRPPTKEDAQQKFDAQAASFSDGIVLLKAGILKTALPSVGQAKFVASLFGVAS
jgi:hypothetical protein